MKVLIITYYWPPAGGSGVQRWLKFVKYLQDFGIEPIVYTVDNANYPKEDDSLISEIGNVKPVVELTENNEIKMEEAPVDDVTTSPLQNELIDEQKTVNKVEDVNVVEEEPR